MAKAYLVLCYHSASDEKALQEYAKLALPAMQGDGGRYLARGSRPRPTRLDSTSAL